MDRTTRWIVAALFLVALSLRLAAARVGGLSAAEAHLWLSHQPRTLWAILVSAMPSPFTARLISASMAAVASPLTFLIGRRLHSAPVGVWAAALAAVSYAAWFQESQMLGTGVVTLCVTYAAWFSLRANDAPAPVPLWVLYAAACVVMPLLDPSTVLVDVTLLLLGVCSPAARIGLSVGAGAGMVAGVFAWRALSVPTVLDLPGRLIGLLLPLYIERGSLHGGLTWVPILLHGFDLLGWCLIALGIAVAWWRARLEGLFCLACVLASVAAPVAAAGLFYTVLALGLARVRALPAVALFLGINAATAVVYPLDSYWWPGNWPEVAAFIQATRDPSDRVVGSDGEVQDALRLLHIESGNGPRTYFVTTRPVALPRGRVEQTQVVPGLNRDAQITVYVLDTR